MLRELFYRLALLLLALPMLQRSNTPAPTATPMIHQSSMGPLESDWRLAEIPAAFRGDWLVLPAGGVFPTPQVGPDYGALVFRLAQSPADCRVDLVEGNDPRPIGTMPYLYMEGDELVAVFTGEFHLTYALGLHQDANGEVAGTFEHAGSGVVYFTGDVQLLEP